MSEHTPGPWSVEEPGISLGGIAQVPYVVFTSDDQHVAAGIEYRADARLIAAAPDLLAEAMSVIDQIEGIGIEDWHGAEGLDTTGLRAAIVKAIGG